MSKHTPGPWYASLDAVVSILGGPGWSVGPIGRTVAATPNTLDEDSDGNARLIAAAPDLLEACRELVADLFKHATFGLNEHEVEMLRKGLAAIAKAEGTE
jgi:hypothetical protein